MRPVAGRPYLQAKIPDDNERSELIGDFYRVIKNTSYKERSALARGLYYKLPTVQGWYYSSRTPPFDVMRSVVKWDKAGRPIVKRRHEESYFNI